MPSPAQLAELCLRSYGDGALNLPWATHEQRIKVGDGHALCVRVGSDIVVAFRGTDSLHDWLLNGRMDKVDYNGGRCHAGFKIAADAIRGSVDWYIRNHGPRAVYLTGHSLGGAMAVLLSILVQPKHVVTFGCPRVGDAMFVDSLRSEIVQYVTPADKVAWLPPASFGYRHATRKQQMCFPDGTASEVILDDMAEPDVVRPHSMVGYLEAVSGLREAA